MSGVFFFVFIALVITFQKDPNLASAMVAFGTLVLALVTALHILNSNEQEKRRRRERLLNEIIEWVVDVGKKCEYETDPQEANAKQILEGNEGYNLAHDFLFIHRPAFENGFSEVRWKNEFIAVICKEFGNTLQKKLQEFIAELTKHLNMLQSPSATETPEETIKTAVQVANHNLRLTNLTREVMEEAAKIKTRYVCHSFLIMLTLF